MVASASSPLLGAAPIPRTRLIGREAERAAARAWLLDDAVPLPTPPYPAYPSGFSAVSGAAAVVLAHVFPRAEVDLLASAAEAAAQRCWSGIHFPIDDDVGLEMGYQVGRLVNTVARDDGAE